MKKQKISTGKKIKRIVFASLATIFVLIVIFAKQIFGEDHFIGKSLGGVDDIGKWFKNNFETLINTAVYIIIFIFVIKLLHLIFKSIGKIAKRGKSVVNLTESALKYILVISLVIIILNLWGVDTVTLATSIGVLGLVIGLGAQSLIEDVIAGLFIVFERTYDIGDVIVVDGFRGEVLQIGIRTTKLVDMGGDIQTINNSDIRKTINMTHDNSLAITKVGIEYGESLERVENVIAKNLSSIKEKIPTIVEGPFYKGVSELGESSVNLMFLAKCKEADKYQTNRDLNREIKLIFDKNNINIPFPQIVLNQAQKIEKAKYVNKAAAEKFVEEQKEASKHIKQEV